MKLYLVLIVVKLKFFQTCPQLVPTCPRMVRHLNKACMDGWMDGYMYGCMHVCMYVRLFVCRYKCIIKGKQVNKLFAGMLLQQREGRVFP